MPKSRHGRKYSARSKKRQGTPVTRQGAAIATAAPAVPKPSPNVPSARTALPDSAQYFNAVAELKRIGILAGTAVAILIVLALLLT